MKSKTIILFIAALLTILQLGYAEEENYPPEVIKALKREKAKTKIQVSFPIEREWVNITNTDNTTHSAIEISRAINTETGKPFDSSYKLFACDLKDLRREFKLEKTEYFLGEPILVEFRIELTGEGKWLEMTGCNYRARGRDDNFLFIMRDADGNWLEDTCGKYVSGIGGGLGSERTITKEEKFSYWVPVQHWCIIQKPGVYDLFCFYTRRDHNLLSEDEAILQHLPQEVLQNYTYSRGGLVSKTTGAWQAGQASNYLIMLDWKGSKPSRSPLLDIIPKEVLSHILHENSLTDLSADELDHYLGFTDYVHFKIIIREPSQKEALQMVKEWSQKAMSQERSYVSGEWSTAANEAIWFVRQNSFFPFIEEELKNKKDQLYWLEGLAMNPDKKAMELLMKVDLKDRLNVMSYLSDERKMKMIPLLIDSLTHQDEEVRSMSEELLRVWTGQSFNHTWIYYHLGRPTLQEAKEIQPLWREWWNKNKNSMKIRDPYAESMQQVNSKSNITNSSPLINQTQEE